MPAVFMINAGDTFRLEEDWSPELTWTNRNLVLFRKLKLTGQKKVAAGRHAKTDKNGVYLRDDNGCLIYEPHYRNETVANPIFKNDDGSYTPVVVKFPKDLEFIVTKLDNSYNGFIISVWLKVIKSPDPRFTDRCVSVKLSQINGANIEIITTESDDEV